MCVYKTSKKPKVCIPLVKNSHMRRKARQIEPNLCVYCIMSVSCLIKILHRLRLSVTCPHCRPHGWMPCWNVQMFIWPHRVNTSWWSYELYIYLLHNIIYMFSNISVWFMPDYLRLSHHYHGYRPPCFRCLLATCNCYSPRTRKSTVIFIKFLNIPFHIM